MFNLDSYELKCKMKTTIEEMEISKIDRRFEEARINNVLKENELLGLIVEQGIREPLQCVITADKEVILLDGFKRLRCCLRLNISVAAVRSLGEDETTGILQLLRLSNTQNLNILEEAALVDKLHTDHGKSIRDIAKDLECSPAWVSVRLGFISEMSESTKMHIFNGQFPARSYIYTLRHFTRVNRVHRHKIDDFVTAVSGKNLSTRDIETLACGFFQGDNKLKEQIKCGNIDWTLKQLRMPINYYKDKGFHEWERKTLEDLELSQKYIKRVIYSIRDLRHETNLFFNTACLLIEDILKELPAYKNVLEGFYAQKRPKESDKSSA